MSAGGQGMMMGGHLTLIATFPDQEPVVLMTGTGVHGEVWSTCPIWVVPPDFC